MGIQPSKTKTMEVISRDESSIVNPQENDSEQYSDQDNNENLDSCDDSEHSEKFEESDDTKLLQDNEQLDDSEHSEKLLSNENVEELNDSEYIKHLQDCLLKLLEDRNNYELDTKQQNNDNEQEISIFVNKELLETSKFILNTGRFDGNLTKREFVEFELLAERNKQNDEEEGAMARDTKFQTLAQKVPNGVIVNSTVFLSVKNWNCISGDKCLLCDQFCTDVDRHVNSESHNQLMSQNPPIEKYDMSIIRKLNFIHHCGICNEIIENDVTSHFETKTHEDKLLFAINKASDIMYDFDLYKNDTETYHFDANNIVVTGNYFTDAAKQNSYIHNDNEYYENTHHDNIDLNIHNDNGDTNEANGLSYASMAKTPKIDHPAFVRMNLSDIVMNVKYNCYHMVLEIRVNRFYCMACKHNDVIRAKTLHCSDLQHLAKVKKCLVVWPFRHYFVRKMDDKFYHCGLCNNLVLINDIEYHIEKKHLKQKLDPNKLKNIPPFVNHEINIHNDKVADNIKTDHDIQNNNVKVLDKLKKLNELPIKVVFEIFGKNVKVLLSQYHVIIKGRCALCNIALHSASIEYANHTSSERHFRLMNKTVFIHCLGFNLIRLARGCQYYCTLCNMMIDHDKLNNHLKDVNHLKIKNNKEYFTKDAATCDSIFASKVIDELISQVVDKEILDSAFFEKVHDDNESSTLESKASQPEELLPSDSSLSDLNTSENSILESSFSEEEFVYLKFKNSFLCVLATCYNSLVPIDNRRFCFVCDEIVYGSNLENHVGSRSHVDNLKKHGFVDKFGLNLIRQSYLQYHCTICNDIIPKSTLTQHIEGQVHTIIKSEMEKTQKLPPNTQHVEVKTQKETIFLKGNEKPVKILQNFKIGNSKKECNVKAQKKKKNKLIMVDENVMKLSFESWHSLVTDKDQVKCLICQEEVIDSLTHVKTKRHVAKLGSCQFIKKYDTHLLRQINESLINCAVCNKQLDLTWASHTDGKRHETKRQSLLESSNFTDYTDCEEDAVFV